MTHLSPDELIDAIEGLLDSDRQSHVAGCEACRSEVERLRAVLHEAQDSDVPEPSLLFWDQLSTRVRAAITVEADPSRGWRPAWFEWPVLAPIAALAALVAALATAIPVAPRSVSELAATGLAPQPLAPVEVDDRWRLVSGMLGRVTWEIAREAGLMPDPGGTHLAVAGLTRAEHDELLRLLRAELSPRVN
ncbi:MAG: hypothetical protein IT307_07155 [Chloroflexi bacterium]|nr:hypothetical protein [Chloroflexota bacterium]